jgi:hypothetical protein
MLHAIQDSKAIRCHLPAPSTVEEVKTVVVKMRPNTGKQETTEAAADLIVKLNELAKGRPFSIMYRVKKHDPL